MKHKIICLNCNTEHLACRKTVKYCSNSCRAKHLKSHQQMQVANKPLNFIEGKIRFCSTCEIKLHHQTKTGFCSKHYQTENYINNLKQSLIGKTGGIRNNGGNSKKGYYQNIWCDSTYELAYVIYNIDHNINFQRNKKFFIYSFENKERKYYPDFYLPEQNLFIEIKGFRTLQDIEKWKSIDNLKVLYKDDLKYMFDYLKIKFQVNSKELHKKLIQQYGV